MKRVIICGTRFGQFYMEALKYNKDIQLVGILAKGSERSRRCASYYGVKLFLNIDELPSDIDIAFIAVKSEVLGGNGNKIAIDLMERGINVLFEQPIHLKEIAECFNTARKNSVKFVIGNLYRNLPAVRNFVENVRILSEHQKPLFVNIDFATQLSYPVVEIINEILPNGIKWKVVESIEDVSPFQVLILSIDGVELTLRAHNEIDKNDIDEYMHLLFQVTVGYPGGRLSLIDPNDSVIWQPRINFPKIDMIPAGLIENAPRNMKEKNVYYLYGIKETIQREIFTQLWPQTISKDIDFICKIIENENVTLENKRIQENLKDFRYWQKIMENLGYPKITQKEKYVLFDTNYFEKENINELNNGIEIENGIRLLNKACCMTMLHCIHKNIQIKKPYKFQSIDKILGYMDYKEEFRMILIRWIKTLKENNLLIVYENECCFQTPTIEYEDVLLSWNELEKNWKESLGPHTILEYFIDNAKNIDYILKGQIDPTLLLFKEGNYDIALDLYSKTAIAKYLNVIISKEVSLRSSSSTKILEIGAGTGATTQVVCNELAVNNGCKEYIFSDLSKFFLNNAKDRFRKFHWMKYCTLDINKDYNCEHIGREKFDIVIAVGVLNNSIDIEKSLLRIMDVLKTGGIIFLVEAIGESVPMLISQAFMMERSSDTRKNENITFLSIEQWYKLFERINLKLLDVRPDMLSYLNVYNQKLFILKKLDKE